MQRSVHIMLAGIFVLTMMVPAQETSPKLSERIPWLQQRLSSSHWMVRYGVLHDLTGRDTETKRILEQLVRDPHDAVGNQALVRYVDRFVRIDKSLFNPQRYLHGHVPPLELPEEGGDQTLVDLCLGRRNIEAKTDTRTCDPPASLPVLDPTRADDPAMYRTLTIVGILGKPEDAEALHPFLASTNDYVVLGTAKALYRLGDTERAVQALTRMTDLDPAEHLYYITEALHVLKEIDHPDLVPMTRHVLSAVERTEALQPNWLNGFLLLAAQVTGDNVWNPKAPQDPPQRASDE